jgi:cephalosporin hydroxylase
MEQFAAQTRASIDALSQDEHLRRRSSEWLRDSLRFKYTYNFRWLGRPIIQYPQDMVQMQELIWQVRPDLVIETGIAHGGSLVMTASILALLDYADAAAAGETLDPRRPRRKALGIDVDIRAHNREAIESHPMSSRIEMVQGSSVAPEVVRQVRERAAGAGAVLVFLDSNHTHEHVLTELEAYAPLVTSQSYCVVFDTVIEDLPAGSYPDRDWDKGNNPKTAVNAFLASHPEFEIDRAIDAKLQITVAPDGYLRRR